VLLFLVSVGNAQVPSPTPNSSAKDQKKPDTVIGKDIKRWFDIDVFSLATRYRYIRANNGSTLANQQQWQLQFRPRFKFDKKGDYSVFASVSTGNIFTTTWNNTGVGTGRHQTNLFVKHLYFDAKPSKKVELQFGGIDLNRGESTEVTTYDNDGYLTGERLVVRHPKALFFDEISLTNAYLGDTTKPSIFGRLHRLNEANYHQFLLRKQATKEIGLSADYTFWNGADILHQAIKAKPKGFFLTTMLFDAYERVSTPTGSGFNAFGERVINKYITVNGGFARIDRLLVLNADKFPPGKRAYASVSFRPNKEFSIAPFIAEGIGHLDRPSTHRTRFEIVFSWNVLESLRKHNII
jgi:hypothetical protein